jgi:hypothetical protein
MIYSMYLRLTDRASDEGIRAKACLIGTVHCILSLLFVKHEAVGINEARSILSDSVCCKHAR